MAIVFDMNNQRILAQFNHFYQKYTPEEGESIVDPLSRHNSHIQYDQVYEFLMESKVDIGLPEMAKGLFWEFAKREVELFHPGWLKQAKSKKDPLYATAVEHMKRERTRFYKTYMARYYLLNQLKEGKRIGLLDDKGKEITLLNLRLK